jgi:hypothetical protein
MAHLLLASLSACRAVATQPALTLTFHPPQKVSAVSENCASAGGTDGFYSVGPPDGTHVFGMCHTNEAVMHSDDSGAHWSSKIFNPDGASCMHGPPPPVWIFFPPRPSRVH